MTKVVEFYRSYLKKMEQSDSLMSPMTFLKAIEAGVDIIDTVMTPYAYRTSHAAIEPLVMTLLGTNRDTGFDIKHLAAINEILEKNVGDTVNQGETVVTLEAMKMENSLPAPASGTIKAVNYSSGDTVAKGDILLIIG